MVSIIAAVAQNGVIGNANTLIWHISEDLKRFKAITLNSPVIMGRKTFESLGRPLPNRTNVVITRQSGYAPEGCRVVHSLSEAIALFPAEQEVFIIGGGEVYRQALPLADRMYLTVVHKDYAGDTHFPQWNPTQWEVVSEENHMKGANFEYPFTFITYQKKQR